MARRLPLYLLLDTSGSMFGEPIAALNNGVSLLIHTLSNDPIALDSVWVSIITFNSKITQLQPLTALADIPLQNINCPRSGPTLTGKALEFLEKKVKVEVRKNSANQKGDWRPVLVIFTDGKASDSSLFNKMIQPIKDLNFATILACGAGEKVDFSELEKLTTNIMRLDTLNGEDFMKFFKWVSTSIEASSKTIGIKSNVTLPLPPLDIDQVM